VAEGPGGVTVIAAPRPRAPRAIEEEIRRRRLEIGALAAELDRRRRELTNPRELLRRHAAGVAVTVLAVGAAAAGSPETAWMTTPWGIALVVTVLIVFVGLALRGRAFGPRISMRAREDRSTAEYAVAVGSLLHRTGARRVTLEALLSATRRAVAQRIGLGGDVPSDRLNATIEQRAPAAAAELARAERELEGASGSEAEVLAMARRLHDLAYPLSGSNSPPPFTREGQGGGRMKESA